MGSKTNLSTPSLASLYVHILEAGLLRLHGTSVQFTRMSVSGNQKSGFTSRKVLIRSWTLRGNQQTNKRANEQKYNKNKQTKKKKTREDEPGKLKVKVKEEGKGPLFSSGVSIPSRNSDG